MNNVRYDYLKATLAEYDAAFSAFDHTDEARANVDEAWKRLTLGIIPNIHALIDIAEAAKGLDRSRLEYLKSYLEWSEIQPLLDALKALE